MNPEVADECVAAHVPPEILLEIYSEGLLDFALAV
jgi:hypothetical protein